MVLDGGSAWRQRVGPAGVAAQTVTVLRNEEKDDCDCVDIQGRQGSGSLASTLLEDVIRHKEWKDTELQSQRGQTGVG